MGLILNEFFTGEVPQGTGYKKISEISADYGYLDAIVERLIRQDPKSRFASISELKLELLARGNDFIAQQKLSTLKNTVIPESEVDDPFVVNPISILRVADYRSGQLTFELSAAPPPNWMMQFRGLGNYSSIMGSGPPYFTFSGKFASVPVSEQSAQQVVNHMKNYVSQTNDAYRSSLEQTRRHELEKRQRDLKAKIAEEERRAQVLSRLTL